MKLIDADALHRKVKTETNPYGKPTIAYDSGVKVLEWIDKAPTIDAVKVVRCRDCKYHHWEQEPCHGKIEHYCELPHMRGIEVFEEFFCYYGKQKEYDNNG